MHTNPTSVRIRRTVLAVALTAATAGMPAAGAGTAAVVPDVALEGSGSTFASKLIQQWTTDVGSLGLKVAYEGTGSSAGRKAFVDGSVDFAGSDVPFSAEEAKAAQAARGGFVYVPATAGGIALMFKLQGVSEVKLSGPTIAKILSGTITSWDDAAIAADNGSKLPKTPIKVFVRSGGSGTSSVLTGYLSAVAPSEWKAGVTDTFPTDKGQTGVKGSDGVADAVAKTEGAIGYAEAGFADERKLPVVAVRNGAGSFRKPTAEAVTAAIQGSKVKDDATIELNFSGPDAAAYPISTVSYIIAPVKTEAAKATNLKAFLGYAIAEGQGKAAGLGFAPLPANLLKVDAAQIAKIGG
jgi:phosphate transport system substrate-binding protein